MMETVEGVVRNVEVAHCACRRVGSGLDAHRADGDGRRATTGPAALGACAGSVCGDQSLNARAGTLLGETSSCCSATSVGIANQRALR